MAYVTVQEETPERLRLTRQPSNNSWVMLVCFVAFGCLAAYYGYDNVIWKVIYVACGIFTGICCMDDWEECDFNKQTGEIRLKKHSAWDLILTPFTAKDSVIVCRMSEVINVRLEEERMNYFGNSYQVVLVFNTGMSIGITETFTFSKSQEHKQVATTVRKFLGLPEDENDPLPGANYEDNFEDLDSSTEEEDEVDEGDVDDNDDVDTDDFETIDKSELIEADGNDGQDTNEDKPETEGKDQQ